MTPRVPCLSTAEGLETESPNLDVFLVVWKRPGSMPRDPEHCQQVIRKDFPLCCPSARRLAEGAQSFPSTPLQLRRHIELPIQPSHPSFHSSRRHLLAHTAPVSILYCPVFAVSTYRPIPPIATSPPNAQHLSSRPTCRPVRPLHSPPRPARHRAVLAAEVPSTRL